MWFPNRSDTNRPVQAQKTARSLEFRIEAEEELYYPSSENKGADQLRGNREADLRLCFRLCRLLVFPRGGSNEITRASYSNEDEVKNHLFFSSLKLWASPSMYEQTLPDQCTIFIIPRP